MLTVYIQTADQQYQDAFNDELESFKGRVRGRAKIRIEKAMKEYEEEERQKRIGPGGLDPVEVYESLPEVGFHIITPLYPLFSSVFFIILTKFGPFIFLSFFFTGNAEVLWWQEHWDVARGYQQNGPYGRLRSYGIYSVVAWVFALQLRGSECDRLLSAVYLYAFFSRMPYSVSSLMENEVSAEWWNSMW